MHGPFCHHHFPKMPFMHKPVYPFMPHKFHIPYDKNFGKPNFHPFLNPKPTPPSGVTEVHFVGKFVDKVPGNMTLANGQTVPVTEVKSITVKIDFKIDNKLLARMRNQFAMYHIRWMRTMGGIMGGYNGMRPHMRRAFNGRDFRRFRRFPGVMNKLVRLHQMIARHEAFEAMLQDARDNQRKVDLLEKKLMWMQKKFGKFKEKMAYMHGKEGMMQKKIGKEKEGLT